MKVELTKEEKRKIGRPSSPRWELDLIAYKGRTNEVLAIECKSYLDSTGVLFRDGNFENPDRYKLFTDEALRRVVLERLALQLVASDSCRRSPKITLSLAIGKVAGRTDLTGLRNHFAKNGWQLFEPTWVHERLLAAAEAGYENDIAFVVSKILLRR